MPSPGSEITIQQLVLIGAIIMFTLDLNHTRYAQTAQQTFSEVEYACHEAILREQIFSSYRNMSTTLDDLLSEQPL